MSHSDYLFTSESVSEGHPDKVCDQISDAVLDAYMAEEPEARLACETLATTNRVILAGEVRGPRAVFDRLEEVARETVRTIGYAQRGFHWRDFLFSNFMHEQSPDIAQGVDASRTKEEGAGDQGLMFGYATDETPALMPAPIHYAHAIMRTLSEWRKAGVLPQLGPDAKGQLTVRYENGRPVCARTIVISTQHLDASLSSADIREIVAPVVRAALPEGWLREDTIWHVNPTGRFVKGGPDGDAGLTGRKIIVDTYGGAAPHGGGAFSGKDPTKVDRSAAYAARYLAKNVVASGLARRCTIQLAYAIGVAEPLSLYVNTHGTGEIDDSAIRKAVFRVMDLTPRGIREFLNLNRPIYRRTASCGHFGRDPDEDGGFTWEKVDQAESLRRAA